MIIQKLICISTAGVLALLGGNSHALTVTIGPTQSIQAALDQVHNAGGGTVHLNAGTYVTYSSCKIYSNVTLEGAGQGSTIIEPPNSGFTTELINDGTHAAGPNLTAVKIQNMTLNGLGMTAYNSMGIQICPATGTDTSVTLNNIEVENCAQGAGIGLMNGFTLSYCNFHNSGVPVQGKAGLIYQNAYITSSLNVNIPGASFNYGGGCGLKCGFGGTGLSITCTASGNGHAGISVQADTGVFTNVTLQNCVTQNNLGTLYLDAGIIAMGNNLQILGCTSQNNDSWGIRTLSGWGSIQNCTSTGNAKSPQYILATGFTSTNNK